MDTRVERAYDVRNTLRSAPHAMTLISEPVRAELISAYTAPDRHYHDLRHVEALLGLSDACASAITDRDAVEAAIWFHDAIYDTRRSDNEERSAADESRIARIAAMIRATAGHAVPDFADAAAGRDCALFLDMDLAILGGTAADFDAYEAAVRREYDWVTEPQWKLGRRAVLAQFLARPAIYATARFGASHEAAARRNLAQAIARLDRSAGQADGEET
jgi:predicted metal-dependent HD superfamily phosphohydrolase